MTKATLKEKIAVTGMFILVIVVFSFANHDTQKILDVHTHTVLTNSPEPELAEIVTSEDQHITAQQ